MGRQAGPHGGDRRLPWATWAKDVAEPMLLYLHSGALTCSSWKLVSSLDSSALSLARLHPERDSARWSFWVHAFSRIQTNCRLERLLLVSIFTRGKIQPTSRLEHGCRYQCKGRAACGVDARSSIALLAQKCITLYLAISFPIPYIRCGVEKLKTFASSNLQRIFSLTFPIYPT